LSTKLPKWILDHNAKNEETAKNSVFFKLPEGETEIQVDLSEAPKELQKAGLDKIVRTRWQYRIVVNGESKILEVGKQLDTQIIQALMKGLNPMVVIRAGKDIKSKYSVKGLE
jgi:hypothetical protein